MGDKVWVPGQHQLWVQGGILVDFGCQVSNLILGGVQQRWSWHQGSVTGGLNTALAVEPHDQLYQARDLAVPTTLFYISFILSTQNMTCVFATLDCGALGK